MKKDKQTQTPGIKIINGLTAVFNIIFIILLPFCAGDVLKMLGGRK